MLTDPLVVKSLDPTPATAVTVLDTNSYPIIDAGPGRSVRRCAAPAFGGGFSFIRPATLTISHSVSGENGSTKTDRALLRLDFLIEDANGKELKMFAYAVFGIPQGTLYADPTNPMTSTQVRNGLLGALSGLLLSSETAATFDEAKFARVIAGES